MNDLGLPKGSLALSLVSFNLGVEAASIPSLFCEQEGWLHVDSHRFLVHHLFGIYPLSKRGGQVPPQSARVERALSECARSAST
jgi:hypothetical protein